MKTKLFTLFIALVVTIGSTYASNTQVDGIWYDFDTSSLTATVTYGGSSSTYYASEYFGEITIPSSVTYGGKIYSVTSIGEEAFKGCSELHYVEIPNSVLTIGNQAFKCCDLTLITCKSVTPPTLGDNVFSDVNKSIYLYVPEESVNAYKAAEQWGEFTNIITIDKRKCKIDELYYILHEENNTAEVISQYSVYPYWSYYSSSKIEVVVIPSSITYNEVTYNVITIGSNAFYNFQSLNSVEIPNSVTSIGSGAFSDCSNLTSIEIPNSVTSIGEGAFYQCFSLTSIDIPNSVTSIEGDAFFYCNGLTSVTMSNSVTSIGNGAFKNCFNLSSLEIPNSVTKIGDLAFSHCTSLTSIEIPNSVTSIGEGVFNGCTGFPVVDNIRYADTYLIEVVDKSLSNYTIINGTKWIGENAFTDCSNLTSIEIPNSVESIGRWAFTWCTGLTSIELPYGVTSIGISAFSSCTGLTSVKIPQSVTRIGFWAFDDCISLVDIYATCGDLDRIKQLLDNDERVKYAPLAYTLTVNAENGQVNYPQNNCEELELTATPNVGCHFTKWSDGNTDNPRIIELTQDTTFTAIFDVDTNGTCGDDFALTWTYDDEAKELTISGEGSLNSNYTFGIEAPTSAVQVIFDEGVTSVGNSAFANYTTLKEIHFASTIKRIYEQAFYNCENLENIYCYRDVPCVVYNNTFDGIDKFSCTLHVPGASIEMYKAATGWRDFYYVVALPEHPTGIDQLENGKYENVKIVKDGQILILRGEKVYTVTGQEVK